MEKIIRYWGLLILGFVMLLLTLIPFGIALTFSLVFNWWFMFLNLLYLLLGPVYCLMWKFYATEMWVNI